MISPADPQNGRRGPESVGTADPSPLEGSGEPEEEARRAAQRHVQKALAAGRTEDEDQRLFKKLGVDPTEARELLGRFVERYPAMERWLDAPSSTYTRIRREP